MFGVPFIVCLCATILRTEGSPIFESEYNVTDATSTESSPALICEQNAVLAENSSLYELLNHDQFWFILARSKFVYGEQTWNNVLMQTSTIDNETVHLTFTGEDRNGTCVSSEKGRIASGEKTNRVAVHWPTQEGFLDMVYIDSTMIHFILCYSIDSNATSLCAHNQSEQFVVNNSPAPGENDTMLWLKSHCSAVNADDFIVNDDPKKCVPVVVPPVIIVVNGSEPTAEEMNGTVSQIVIGDQGNVTVITITELESTTRANRTNRLEILEEYYNNATKNETSEESMEEAATMEMKPIVLLSANVSAIEGIDRINVTFVEQNGKTSEPATNETVAEESSSTVVHETKPTATTEIDIEPLNSAGHPSTSIPESSNVTDVQTTKHTPIAVTTEKEFSTEPNTSPVVEHSSTAEHKTSPVIIEIATTTESTTPATTIPADCPPLEGCPFEYCAFARKLDNRGCPTCNCLHSNKSNITCPASACQPCLYGHYTDSNGCPVCQCQSRPYPPLGERCPVLQCEPCYFGTVKDEYNCDTCICIRPNNQECPVLACPFGPCKYGSLKDEDDCATCDCLLPSTNVTKVNCSTPVSCAPCHLGYVRNADGCQTCQCKLRGSVPCGSVASQCHCDYGAYLDSDGCETCSCLPDPKNASRQACWELSNHANFYNLSGPICSPDGSFYARQCDKSRCWCVTPSGLHISNFESHPNESVNCACAVEQYQVSSLRMIGHHLLCLLSGNYAPIQCDGRYCSCVDENGKAIGPSVSAQNRNELRCVGVYQQLHPERFIVHRSSVENTKPSRSPHGMPTSLCLKHLEQVRHANVTDEHILIPVCDGNGLYAAVQCDQNERYCWCVDKKTGVEMDGTRRLNARPNCNAA